MDPLDQIEEVPCVYFVEAGAIAVRHVRKEDICHVAKSPDATLILGVLKKSKEAIFQKLKNAKSVESTAERAMKVDLENGFDEMNYWNTNLRKKMMGMDPSALKKPH